MASKGTVRTGETYCLSCYEIVDKQATKCPSCGSDLTEDVRAFLCPKCRTVLTLGEPQCRNCGLKFKVKTLKPKEEKQDDQFLMKLIEWGKAPPEEAPGAEGRPAEAPATPSAEQLKRLTQLKESIRDLMDNRSEMLERMGKRLDDEKTRLAQISAMEGRSESSEQVEAEIMSLADEMADITMLQAHMEALSDEISTLMDTVEVSAATKERGLAARALRKRLDEKEREVAELKAKEEQLVKREEMVDRKIQAYAQKKKQLDDDEEALKAKLSRLEEERAEIERLKATATGARTDTEREEASARWTEEQEVLKKRLAALHSTVAAHRAGKESEEADPQALERDLNSTIAELEQQIASVISEKVELQGKIGQAESVDDDLKRLLKVLDQMLGQLPEEVIERFSKSEEFSLYEKVLDRLKI